MSFIKQQETAQLVRANNEELKSSMQDNPSLWIAFNMGEAMDVPTPDFHVHTFRKLVNTASDLTPVALALPREHAKTTLARLAVVHYFSYTDKSFCLYLSDTTEVAVASVKAIVAFLESENYRAVFGDVIFTVRQDGVGYYEFECCGRKRILKAAGAGKQIRGTNIQNMRPDLLVVDDLEDRDAIENEQLQRKLNEWVYGTLLKALNKRKAKIIWLGNMISNTCLLKDWCEDPDWDSMRLGAILSNGQSLWPDLWSIEALRKDFAKYQRKGMSHIWFAEMMNMPVTEGMGVIELDQIQYEPPKVREDVKFSFIVIDPAISKKSWADDSALAVHGYIEGHEHNQGYWQIVESYKEFGMDPISLLDKALEMAHQWGTKVIGIEEQAFQSVLRVLYEYILQGRGIFDIEFVGVKSANITKTNRIAGWCGFMREGTYRLTEGDFEITEQLLNYDPLKDKNRDDLLDACAYGVQMIENWMHVIQASGKNIVKRSGREVRSHQMCDV